MSKPRHTQSGVVMMEFLIALMPVMLGFLGMCQFSLGAVGKLLVRHAAVVGARAAVVVIEESADVPGTPENVYEGLPAGELELDEENDDVAHDAGGLSSATNSAGSSLQDSLESMLQVLDRSRSRISQIRTAAYFPLLAISPDAISDGLGVFVGNDQQNVRDAFGDTGPLRLVGAFLYNLGAVAVTFPTSPGSEEFRTEPYAHGDEVTVRVTYMFKCNVPFASLLLCDSGLALFSGISILDPATLWRMRHLTQAPPSRIDQLDAWQRRVTGALDSLERRQDRVDAFGDRGEALDQVESPIIQSLLLLRPGARYMLIEAEATLPVQSAQYYPRTAAGGEGES